MALQLSDAVPLSTRSIEALIGTGALAGEPATATSQLADLGTIASVLDGVSSGTGIPGAAGSAVPADLPVAGAAVDAANATVLTTHASLEGTGHDLPVANGPLHGLTNLGETVGLGHIGETQADGTSNLLTDVAGLPQAVADGHGTSSVTPALSDVGDVASAATVLATSAANVVEPGAGLVGSGGLATPFLDAANVTVGALEGIGHSNAVLDGPVHAVTSLGDAIGLGHVGDAGQPNVLTDLLDLPGNAVSGGGIGAVGGLIGDLGHAVGTAGDLPGSLAGVAGPEGGILGSGGLLSPVSGLANAAVLDIHASIENTGHAIPVANEPLHALTNLGETIGLGHLGEAGPAGPSNVLTDVVNAPGTALSGDPVGALTPILSDSGAVAGAVDRVVDSVTHIADAAPGTGLPDAGALGGALPGLGGALPGLGGPLPGIVDGLVGTVGSVGGGGASGTAPLVTVSIGAADATPLGGINLLAPSDPGPTHAADAHVGTAPAGQPPALAIGLLGGDAIAVPSLGGSGADALVGALAETAPTAAVPALHDATPGVDLASLTTTAFGAVDGHDAAHQGAAHASPLHGLI